MAKILFIASDYKPKPGGIAAYLDTLARGLIDLGNTLHVLAVIPPEDTKRASFLANYEPWVSPFPMAYDQRPKNWLADKCVSIMEMVRCSSPSMRRVLDWTTVFRSSSEAVQRLRRIVFQQSPDLVLFGHLDIYQYPFVLFLQEIGLSYSIIAHDSEVYRSAGRRNDLLRRGMMLKKARCVVANSRHTRALLEEWSIPSERIKLIHPPITEEAIQSSSGLTPHPTLSGGLRVVTICRLVKTKGVDLVIRSLKILAEQAIPFHYTIAGDGSERGNLEALARELGVSSRVRFVGHISEHDKWCLLRDHHIFIMPSRVVASEQHEGFGIGFMEGAAFGLPGVGSNAGGIPDAVIDGQTGLLVREESPEEIAAALCFLYRNPEKRCEMGRAAMDRAREQFSPVAVASRFQREVIAAEVRPMTSNAQPRAISANGR